MLQENDNNSPLDSDEDFILRNDKGQFLPGSKAGLLNKGVKKESTLSLSNITASDWKELRNYITTFGVQKFTQALEQLEGKDFINAYIAILPYVKGKIANVDVSNEEDGNKPKAITHTVTIRDMRDGSVKALK